MKEDIIRDAHKVIGDAYAKLTDERMIGGYNRMKEADLKRAVEDYLQYKQNAGELVFLRLNAGDFIEVRGNTRRRIKGCPKGTADFLVFMKSGEMVWGSRGTTKNPLFQNLGRRLKLLFLELKSEKGTQSKEQKEFQEMVENQGASYFLIRSIEEMEVLK